MDVACHRPPQAATWSLEGKAPFLVVLGNVFGEAGIVTNFSGMWFTLSLVALVATFLIVFAFEDETVAELSPRVV